MRAKHIFKYGLPCVREMDAEPAVAAAVAAAETPQVEGVRDCPDVPGQNLSSNGPEQVAKLAEVVSNGPEAQNGHNVHNGNGNGHDLPVADDLEEGESSNGSSEVKLAAAAASVAGFPMVHSDESNHRIRIGQIGTKHPHASGKMAALRSLNDLYEVVGIVEPDESRRKAMSNTDAYRDLKWMMR